MRAYAAASGRKALALSEACSLSPALCYWERGYQCPRSGSQMAQPSGDGGVLSLCQWWRSRVRVAGGGVLVCAVNLRLRECL